MPGHVQTFCHHTGHFDEPTCSSYIKVVSRSSVQVTPESRMTLTRSPRLNAFVYPHAEPVNVKMPVSTRTSSVSMTCSTSNSVIKTRKS